ncbi:protein GlxC [Sulfitobacter sp.]|jgi:glutamate synthase domain-containing protein 3|uniref:GltB/FmdC/FwdC-like GXGXG domain-containing protein n=1 Tax=Sulfitobacter sp. TaxID=1903071 RepID=UPI003002CEDE
MQTIDLSETGLRETNKMLHTQADTTNPTSWTIKNAKGAHAIACGLNAPIDVTVKGSTGYYCGGMNQQATVNIHGSAGPGTGENIMSGKIVIDGDASQYLGATGHGGWIVVKGNASSRCGISMKGVNIVVQGNVGHMSAFMGQSGSLLVCGDAGDALGDSCYEARFFVRGTVKSLGADCEKKEMRAEHIEILTNLLKEAKIDADPSEFTRYGSARILYNFDVDNATAY